MSDTRTKTNIAELASLGMLTLRASPDAPGLSSAVKSSVGLGLPGPRAILSEGDRAVAWMSPDEYLLILPKAEVGKALTKIAKAMGATHHLAVDVSDARAVFRIEGSAAEGVIARLCPADLARLPMGEMRRTRVAQVACALWRVPDGFMLVAFRSVEVYVRALLDNAARSVD